PAAGPRVLPGAHRARAGPAADARIALRVERAHRHVVPAHVVPHRVARPGHERIDLDEPEACVALEDLGPRTIPRLVAADRGDPGLEARARGLQRLDLADRAAAVGIALPQAIAVERPLLLEVEGRADGADLEAIARLEPAPQRVGLGE